MLQSMRSKRVEHDINSMDMSLSKVQELVIDEDNYGEIDMECHLPQCK